MNDYQQRINLVTQKLASESSKIDKVVTSLQVFSGMDITHFSRKKTESVYKHIATMNSIISRYPVIKTYEDYALISDIDLNKILKSIQQLCLKLLID